MCRSEMFKRQTKFIKQIGRADVSLCSEQLDRKEMRAICVILMVLLTLSYSYVLCTGPVVGNPLSAVSKCCLYKYKCNSTFSPSLTPFLSHSLSISLSLPLSHSLSHSLSIYISISVSLSLTLCLSLLIYISPYLYISPYSPYIYLYHYLFISLSPSLSLPLSLSHPFHHYALSFSLCVIVYSCISLYFGHRDGVVSTQST